MDGMMNVTLYGDMAQIKQVVWFDLNNFQQLYNLLLHSSSVFTEYYLIPKFDYFLMSFLDKAFYC